MIENASTQRACAQRRPGSVGELQWGNNERLKISTSENFQAASGKCSFWEMQLLGIHVGPWGRQFHAAAASAALGIPGKNTMLDTTMLRKAAAKIGTLISASLIALFSMFLFAAAAHALVLQPLAADMRSSGSLATTSFRVVNDGPTPMPVEVTFKRLTLGETGGPVLTDAKGDEFLIFPPQAVIRPGATQIFRVQWVGDPALRQSQSYMIAFSQVPVDRPEGVTGIAVLYSLQAVVSVAPIQGVPALKLVSAQPSRSADGKPQVEVVIENDSPVHGYFSRVRLQLQSPAAPGRPAWNRTWSTGEMGAITGLGLVPGGQRRRFIMPLDQPQPGPFTGTLLRAESRR